MADASRSTASIAAATSRAPAGAGACVPGATTAVAEEEEEEEGEGSTVERSSGGGGGGGSRDSPAAAAGSISLSCPVGRITVPWNGKEKEPGCNVTCLDLSGVGWSLTWNLISFLPDEMARKYVTRWVSWL